MVFPSFSGRFASSMAPSNAAPEELPAALAEAIFQKPRAHCFGDPASVPEQKRMNEIGG